MEFDENLPRVRILHTGGTIASKVDYKTGAVVARFEPHELVASIPELAKIANIEACLLYTSPSPRDLSTARMPSSA